MARVFLVTRLCNCCKTSKNLCRRPGTHLRVFRTGSSSRACSTTSPTEEVRRFKTNVQLKRMATYATRLRPGFRCFCGPGSEKTWTLHEERPSHQFAEGEWDNLVLRMMREVAKEGRRSYNAFQKRARHSLHARDCDLGVQSTLCTFSQ